MTATNVLPAIIVIKYILQVSYTFLRGFSIINTAVRCLGYNEMIGNVFARHQQSLLPSECTS